MENIITRVMLKASRYHSIHKFRKRFSRSTTYTRKPFPALNSGAMASVSKAFDRFKAAMTSAPSIWQRIVTLFRRLFSKKLAVASIICTLCIVTMISGCGNKDWFDTKNDFDYAIVKMPDGDVVKLAIKAWADYEGEQLLIKTPEGDDYLVNSVNCVLVSEGRKS